MDTVTALTSGCASRLLAFSALQRNIRDLFIASRGGTGTGEVFLVHEAVAYKEEKQHGRHDQEGDVWRDT